MGAVLAVGPPLRDSASKLSEHGLGSFPVDARVGDGHAVLETSLAFLGYLLSASLDVALNHDTHNGRLSSLDLLSNRMRNLWLVHVVLLRVAVAAVNHQARVHALGLELLTRLLDALRIVICALLSAAKDNEAVIVANGANNGDDTRLGDGKEVVRVLCGANGVNGDIESAVCAVLETNRERQT